MDPDHASDHLQVIRTLMERVAVYRRALAPIMITVGVLGSAAGALGYFTRRFDSNRAFAMLWLATAVLSVIVTYLLVRRQAFKADEAFWSPPTRRVSQALVPGFFAGGMAGLLIFIGGPSLPPVTWLVAIGWTAAYGCALHAAGFFMERGIKLFGLVFTCLACVLLVTFSLMPSVQGPQVAHGTMGFFFGVMQLVYGAYLHLTERQVKA